MIIEWAEENDLPNNEILALLRIREKAVIKNICNCILINYK